MAARAGVAPTTLQLKVIDSTNAPQHIRGGALLPEECGFEDPGDGCWLHIGANSSEERGPFENVCCTQSEATDIQSCKWNGILNYEAVPTAGPW